jgi:hypothetical protein
MTQPAHDGKEDKTEVWQGTLALMVLTTLEALGAQHGFGTAIGQGVTFLDEPSAPEAGAAGRREMEPESG